MEDKNLDSRTVAARQHERDEIARQIEIFINEGGQVTVLESCCDNPEHYAFNSFSNEPNETSDSQGVDALDLPWLPLTEEHGLDQITA